MDFKRGTRVAFTGKLDVCTRDVADALVGKLGGQHSDEASCHYLVVADTGRHGTTAKQSSVPVEAQITEREFWLAMRDECVKRKVDLDETARAAHACAASRKAGGKAPKLPELPSSYLARVGAAFEIHETFVAVHEHPVKRAVIARDPELMRLLDADVDGVFGGDL